MDCSEIKIIDDQHFYYGDYLVDLPSILYQIIPLHDGKLSHRVSTSFTAIARLIEYWNKHQKPSPNAEEYLRDNMVQLATSGIKGTPFNVYGELLA